MVVRFDAFGLDLICFGKRERAKARGEKGRRRGKCIAGSRARGAEQERRMEGLGSKG